MMWVGSSLSPILSKESVPKEASSVDGAVDTVEGVPMMVVVGSERESEGPAVGLSLGDDAGLR